MRCAQDVPVLPGKRFIEDVNYDESMRTLHIHLLSGVRGFIEDLVSQAGDLFDKIQAGHHESDEE